MSKYLSLCLTVVAIALFGAACDDDGGNKAEPIANVNVCTDDASCREGYLCVDNLCVLPSRLTSCSADADCASGLVCMNKFCRTGERSSSASACVYSYNDDWTACQPDGTQTRTVASKTPEGCIGTPELSRTCTYTAPVVPPTVSIVPCTFEYTDFGACQPGGTQTRTVASKSPEGCTGDPELERPCTYVNACDNKAETMKGDCVIPFKNDALKNAVIEEIKKKEPAFASTNVTLDDCGKITSIREDKNFSYKTGKCSAEGQISDLSGIEYCTGLQEIILRCHTFKDIAPLSDLKQLSTLYISNNAYLSGDLAPISGLNKLQKLYLAQLEGLKGDIGQISGLNLLTNLQFSHTGLQGDFGILSGMTRLNSLSLLSTDLAGNLGALSGLTEMNYLNLHTNKGISGTLVQISGLNKLQILQLSVINLSGDLEPLRGMTKLNHLDLIATNVSGSLTPIAGLTELQKVYLGATNVSTDLAPLAGLLKLTNLYMTSLKNKDTINLSPLVDNARAGGLGSGDTVSLEGDKLDCKTSQGYIDTLKDTYKVTVNYTPFETCP